MSNIKVVEIRTLKPGDLFSWSLSMSPMCHLDCWNPQLLMYEYSFVSDPECIGYSLPYRTVCVYK